MAERIFFQTLVIGVAVSEWIEITKVGNKDNAKAVTYAPASYEITLTRPQFYEITQDRDPTSPSGIESATIKPRSNDEDYEDDSDEYEDDEAPSPVMSIIKHVQNELLDFKGSSLNAKLAHLKKLRNNMLHEIKYRISRLFKTPTTNESSSRLYKDYYFDEHHLDYPSSEGALMTIGFLTFAVFLIKLVLKLIYTYKMQQQYYQTTTTPVSIFLKREIGRESPEDDESARILRYIEEYSPR